MTRPEDFGDEPLDPELDRLLEAERARPERAGEGPEADRLYARIIAAVGPVPGAGAPPAPTGGGGGAAGGGAAGGGAAGGGAAGGAAFAHPALVGGLALVIGMAAGAVLHATLTPPEVRVVVREVVVDAGPAAPAPEAEPRIAIAEAPIAEAPIAEAPVAEAPVDDALVEEAEPVAAEVAPAARPEIAERAAGRRPDAGAPTTLARESALLARAQSALARGAPELAISALREHDARHPEGQLREEREALWISALVAAGDHDAARERAARFRRRFPGSPLQAAIDATLRESPPGTPRDPSTP
ncbi:outer membrane protein assembly factor BamD [Sandaracinus amylolyticus]|uniref:Uncharacterized protein n=1 Tax=Sandaracinus amylolyticus TaxID=927083 RepID=A0A0F6W0V0_9BACT|nr:outer membrane protein assembly factor BamD [Sandaracinus amylolyticus]AKF04631.1 hypothetical protein DB32_001780 [Sandaracinus amylolyticus]